MKDYIEIQGGYPLSGTLKVSSAKNSAVAILPAVILSSEIVKIYEVPSISDIEALEKILSYLNVNIIHDNNSHVYDCTDIKYVDLTCDEMSKLRASYYFMGALLARFKKIKTIKPGGCNLGDRPIDLHLKGFETLGATIVEGDDYIEISANELIGNEIYLDFASVGATINIMLAATLAKGKTIIQNAAKEPEIINLATMLNNMGANIKGAGTSDIIIHGVNRLKGCMHEIIPDRIEAGTFIILACCNKGNIVVENVIPQHIESLLSKLEEIGFDLEVGLDYVKVKGFKQLKPIEIKTHTFPGFPTDLQQPLTTLLTQINGKSIVKETIYKKRFGHCNELNLMNANISFNEGQAIINGSTPLIGAQVKATDLRCGAALVIAGLIATGTTKIYNAYHIFRGYESIIEKLTSIGAKIK